MIKIGDYIVKPTQFPDGTTQIWQIDDEVLNKGAYVVEWIYEHDGEIFQLMQLSQLLKTLGIYTSLKVDTLPYARQDKEISNNTTFALYCLLEILTEHFIRIHTVDIHNPMFVSDRLINKIPNDRIKEVIEQCNPDLICFPDQGASQRGYDTQGLPNFPLDKNRDQLTGEILGLKCDLPLDLKGKSVILIDDLCDAGGTFIQACKLLKDMGADKVYLYTTHGLYTKGTKRLFDAGLDRIFNYKEEVLK